MKAFYLLRHEDVHSNSGTGVVAEGVIFWDGTGCFTWLTHEKTVTTFTSIQTIRRLHSHGGRTEVIVEGGSKKNAARFAECRDAAQLRKLQLKQEQADARKRRKNNKPTKQSTIPDGEVA